MYREELPARRAVTWFSRSHGLRGRRPRVGAMVSG